jgi:hypothetical protein
MVRTVQKYYRKAIKREAKLISLTQIHDLSLSTLGSGTSMKSGRVKLVL